MASAGLLIGAGGAVGLVQLLKSRLAGVQLSDPLGWAFAAAGLMLVALRPPWFPFVAPRAWT